MKVQLQRVLERADHLRRRFAPKGTTVAFFVSAAAAVYGIALVSVPAAFIVAGLGGMVISFAIQAGRGTRS